MARAGRAQQWPRGRRGSARRSIQAGPHLRLPRGGSLRVQSLPGFGNRKMMNSKGHIAGGTAAIIDAMRPRSPLTPHPGSAPLTTRPSARDQLITVSVAWSRPHAGSGPDPGGCEPGTCAQPRFSGRDCRQDTAGVPFAAFAPLTARLCHAAWESSMRRRPWPPGIPEIGIDERSMPLAVLPVRGLHSLSRGAARRDGPSGEPPPSEWRERRLARDCSWLSPRRAHGKGRKSQCRQRISRYWTRRGTTPGACGLMERVHMGPPSGAEVRNRRSTDEMRTVEQRPEASRRTRSGSRCR